MPRIDNEGNELPYQPPPRRKKKPASLGSAASLGLSSTNISSADDRRQPYRPSGSPSNYTPSRTNYSPSLGGLLGDPSSSKPRSQPAPKPKLDQPNFIDFVQGLKSELKSNKGKPAYQPIDPSMPKGREISLPENRKRTPDGKLKWWWDEEYVKTYLDDYRGDDFAYEVQLNDILDQRFKDKEDWAWDRQNRKRQQIYDVLKNAGEEAHKGNFDYLEKYMKDHPDFRLEPTSFRDEYGTTPEMLKKQMDRELEGVDNVEERRRIRNQYMDPYGTGSIEHYSKIREAYRTNNKKIKDAIKYYETKFGDSLEYHDEEDRPAIPQRGSDPEMTKALDETAGSPGLSALLGDTSNSKYKLDRNYAKKQLGARKLPSIQQMLDVKVQDGTINPDDQGQINDWIDRLKNPNHPETRALYVAFAKQQNPNLDIEGAGLDYINEPVKQHLDAEKEAAKAAKKEQSTVGKFFDYLEDKPQVIDANPAAQGGDLSTGSGGGVSGLMWTIDKLSRPLYAVAAMADAYMQLDQEPESDWSNMPWLGGNAGLQGYSMAVGQNPLSAVDDLKPSGVANIAQEGWSGFFRGSDLPGVDDDELPITWAHVIADANAEDGRGDVYDKSWFQHSAGFTLDVATDPLNFVGVGVVSNTVKAGAKLTRIAAGTGNLADDAIIPARNLFTELDDLSRSPISEKAFRINTLLRASDSELEQGIYRINDDADILPRKRSEASEDPFGGVSIPDQVRKVAEESKKVQSDVGRLIQSEELSKITDDLDGLRGLEPTYDLRMTNLMERDNIVEKINNAIRQTNEAAKLRGFSNDVFLNDAGRKAHAELAKFDDEMARLGTDTESGAFAAERVRLEGKLAESRGHKVAADPRRYLASLSDENVATKFDRLRDEFAGALGIPAKDFPFTTRQIAEAIFVGSKMGRNAATRKEVQALHEQIFAAQDQLNKLPKGSQEYKNTENFLNRARKRIAGISMDGALRYLDALQTLKNEGAVFRDPVEAAKLKQLRSSTGDTTDDVFETAGPGTIDDFTADQVNLADQTVDDLMEALVDPGAVGIQSPAVAKRTIAKEIDRRLEELRLDRDGQLTGLPEQQAYQVKQLLGPTIVKDGKVVTAFKNLFTYDRGANRVRYDGPTLGRSKAAQANKEDVYEAADIIRGRMDDEVDEQYRLLNEKAKRDKAQGVNPSSRYEKRFRDENPEINANSPVRSGVANSWWARNMEEIGSRHELQEIMLRSERGFYETLFTPGSPFKFNLGKTLGGLPPTVRRAKFEFRGKTYRVERDYPSAARSFIENHAALSKLGFNERRAISDASMREWADELYKAVASAPKPTRARLVSDIWNTTLQARKSEWKKSLQAAKDKDLQSTEASKTAVGNRLTAEEQNELKLQAFDLVKAKVFKDIEESGTVKRTWSNQRLTINEQAKVQRRAIREQAALEKGKLQVEATKAGPDELPEIRSKIKAVERSENRALRSVEEARTKGIEGKRITGRRIKEDLLIQIASMPLRVDKRALYVHLAGMRMNLKFTNSMFEGARLAEKYLPERSVAYWKKTFLKPSNRLSAHELQYARVQYDNVGPTILAAHLKRLGSRMSGIHPPNRISMFEKLRSTGEYKGAQADRVSGIKQEFNEIDDILNGRTEHVGDIYSYRDWPNRDVKHLNIREISRYLPEKYRVDLKELERIRSKKGEINFADLYDTMVTAANKKELSDPYTFAHVFRLATDQAKSYKAAQSVVKNNFGVARDLKWYRDGDKWKAKPTEKGQIVEKLRGLGWETSPHLGETHLFPPESIDDINTLFGMISTPDKRSAFAKHADEALSIWKSSMTTYNPGYYSRNGLGEIISSWLDGVVSPTWYRKAMDVVKYYRGDDVELAEMIKRWSALDGKVPVDNVRGDKLILTLKGGTRVTADSALREYVRQGLMATFFNTDLGTGVRTLGAAKGYGGVRGAASKLNTSVHEFGEGFEHYFRIAHFIQAMEKSGKGTIGEAGKFAAEKVRRYHFDYGDFSTFDKAVMLRAFPFYKWTRRAAPLMFQHLFLTPGKSVAIPKAMDAVSGTLTSSDVHEDKNGFLPDYQGMAPAWVQELFAYQLSPLPDDEYGEYFRVSTPQLDSLNQLFQPEQAGGLMPLLGPHIKLPIEFGMNHAIDPEFAQYPIVDADSNYNGDNAFEQVMSHLARTNPITNFTLNKMIDLGYEPENGVRSKKDVIGFLTGLGLYEGSAKDYRDKDSDVPKVEEDKVPAVGIGEIQEILSVLTGGRSRSALSEVEGSNPDLSSGYEGSGYQNFGYGGYGYGNSYGYGGGNSGSGYSGNFRGGSSSGSDLLSLLLSLKRAVDQGDVYETGDLRRPKK